MNEIYLNLMPHFHLLIAMMKISYNIMNLVE